MTSNQLERLIESLFDKRAVLNRRLDAVSDIKVYLEKEIDDAVEDYNKKVGKMHDYLMDGYQGFRNCATLSDSITSLKEGYLHSGDYSGILSALESEISRCRSEITAVNSEIRTRQRELDDVRRQEELEEQKAQQAGGAII